MGLRGNWIAKFEYLYIDFGSRAMSSFPVGHSSLQVVTSPTTSPVPASTTSSKRPDNESRHQIGNPSLRDSTLDFAIRVSLSAAGHWPGEIASVPRHEHSESSTARAVRT